ncbi:MAG: hypothetical protein JXR76_20215 [Deltaproteobacteria bacterium]|nr:hypothetical protein [Deltaproteobacteria bacterium]
MSPAKPNLRHSAAYTATLPWQQDTLYSYKLTMESTASVTEAKGVSDLTLSGILKMIPLEQTAQSIQMIVELSQLAIRSEDPETQPVFDAMLPELKKPFACLYEKGENTFIHTQANLSLSSVSVVRSVCAALQFSNVSKEKSPSWTVNEHDGSGTYEAVYTAQGNNRFSKKKTSYKPTSMEGKLGLGLGVQVKMEVLSSNGEVTLKDGVLYKVAYQEQLRSVIGLNAPVSSKTEFSLVLKDKSKNQGISDWGGLLASARKLDAKEPFSQVKKGTYSFDQEKIGTLTFEKVLEFFELSGQLTAEGVKRQDAAQKQLLRRRTRMFSALTALLRSDEANVVKADAAIRSGSVAAHSLIDGLSSGGSDACQQALLTLAADEKVDLAIRKKAIASILMTGNASAQTVHSLLDIAKTADFGHHMYMGLGTMCRKLQASGQEGLAGEIGAFLVQRLKAANDAELQVTALRGIANSAFTPAFGPASAYLREPYPEDVRAAAVEALRLMGHPRVNDIIADAMGANNSRIQRAALNAAKTREPNAKLAKAVSTVVLESENAATRKAALAIVIKWLPQRPSLKSVLEKVAASDTNPGVRNLAAAAMDAE